MPVRCVRRHHRTGRQIPYQDSQRRQSILGSDPPGEASTILTVDTAGCGHRVLLLECCERFSRRSRDGRPYVCATLALVIASRSHTTLVDAAVARAAICVLRSNLDPWHRAPGDGSLGGLTTVPSW